jgi:TolA-binding protein
MRFKTILSLLMLTTVSVVPASAQRRQATPEQRIERLENQVRQVQGRIFPRGQPVDTAGFIDDPAASQASVTALMGRIGEVERQFTEIIRSNEENGNRLAVMEAELARLRADQERRLRTLESGAAAAAAGARASEASTNTGDDASVPPPSRPVVQGSRPDPAGDPVLSSDAIAEAAYDKGFQQWTAKQYDDAIRTLDAMIKAHPNHRRVSWAHNLAGRALLDKGQPRAAAERLLANYRRDPKGERAQDSLFYLGQSLMRLGQPGQACKAYGELEDVYGDTLRPALRSDLAKAKAAAKCG